MSASLAEGTYRSESVGAEPQTLAAMMAALIDRLAEAERIAKSVQDALAAKQGQSVLASQVFS